MKGRDPKMPRILSNEFQLDFEVKRIIPVKLNKLGEAVFWLLSFVTLGLAALFLRWSKKKFKTLRYTKVQIDKAQYLLVIDEVEEEHLLPIVNKHLSSGKVQKTVRFRHVDYKYD